MNKSNILLGVALAGIVSTVASAGSAVVTIFEDQSSYNAVAGPVSVLENFEFAANGTPFNAANPGLQPGISYAATSLTWFNANFQNSFPSSTQINSAQLWSSSDKVLTITFSTAAKSLSLNMVTWDDTIGIGGNTIAVTVTGGETESFDVSTLGNNPGFFGFVANEGFITQVVLTTADRTVGVDNIAVSSTAIPEPSSAAALVGLAALGGVALRRRRA